MAFPFHFEELQKDLCAAMRIMPPRMPPLLLLPLLLLLCELCCQRVSARSVVVATSENEAQVTRAVELYTQAQRATERGAIDAGIQHYSEAIEAFPDLAGAYNNLAMLLFEHTRDADQAMTVLERGIRVSIAAGDNEAVATMHNNIGYILREHGGKFSIVHCQQALAHFDAALQIDATYIDALNNKAAALRTLGLWHEAEHVLIRILELDPHNVGANVDMATIHFHRSELEQAVERLDLAARSAPVGSSDALSAISNKGIFLRERGHLTRALAAQHDALALAPDDPRALSNAMTIKRLLCDWDGLEELEDHLVTLVTETELAGTAPDNEFGVSLLPYDSTLVKLSSDFRRRITIQYALTFEQPSRIERLPSRFASMALTATRPESRLRVGYLSFDFREHPMGHLTLGLLEQHDRRVVNVLCYSYGPNDASKPRTRIEEECSVFRDLVDVTDVDAARLIANDQIDLLIDLMAHTKGARPGIGALKPSPVVVNYLGFPGTTGSNFTEFAVVDKMIVPPEHAAASMTESVVYLPTTYQVNRNDPSLAVCGGCQGDQVDDDETFGQCLVACQRRGRQHHGLPLDSVVFCNFNMIVKMEATSFRVWMSVLRQVPRSVLWLLRPSGHDAERMMQALRDEAKALGVRPNRLIFAKRVPKSEHIERLTLADLFLDSFVYNAHSTASDALWAHLPIVTMWGDTFPSRVAASLVVNSVGTLDVLSHSVKDYESLAVELAMNPRLLHRLRREISTWSLACPLFDTQRTAENIELAYEAMHDAAERLGPATSRFHLVVNPQQSHWFADAAHTRIRLKHMRQQAETLARQGDLDAASNILVRVQMTANVHVLSQVVTYPAQISVNMTASTAPAMSATKLPSLVRSDAADLMSLAVLAQRIAWHAQRKEHQAIVRLVEMWGDSSNLWSAQLDGAISMELENLFMSITFALSSQNRTADAVNVAKRALASHPTFFRLGYNLAALLVQQGKVALADAEFIKWVELGNRLAFATSGRQVQKRARPRGKAVVAIYCNEYGQSWWGDWGPSSLTTAGLGGSEEAVVFLSQELARLGYWVEVYASPPAKGMSTSDDDDGDDVCWYPFASFDPDDRGVHVFIAWRYHMSLAVGRHAQVKLFWVHDLPESDCLESTLLVDVADRIVCVSAFQAAKFPQELQPKVVVARNGLDPEFFVDGDNVNTRFVYGSAPNRGLRHLLRAWPLVRAALPSAELFVFYGFTPAFEAWGHQRIDDYDNWRADLDERLRSTPGVTYVGLVDHRTLASAYAGAGFYLYPTAYPETSCISLMKAMANGAIPITSRFEGSALRETAGGFDLGPSVLAPSELGIDLPHSMVANHHLPVL